jgi:hypothetical protein
VQGAARDRTGLQCTMPSRRDAHLGACSQLCGVLPAVLRFAVLPGVPLPAPHEQVIGRGRACTEGGLHLPAMPHLQRTRGGQAGAYLACSATDQCCMCAAGTSIAWAIKGHDGDDDCVIAKNCDSGRHWLIHYWVTGVCGSSVLEMCEYRTVQCVTQWALVKHWGVDRGPGARCASVLLPVGSK